MSSSLVPRLQIVAAAFLFSTGGMAVKSCELSDWQIASFRSGVAAVVLWILLPAARQGWSRRTWLVGTAYAAMLTLFVLSTKATTAANAVLLQSTAPLYLVLLGPLLLGESVRARDLAVMAVIALGLGILLTGDVEVSATTPAPVQGNLLGALAGLCWALTILGLRWLGRAGGGAPSAVVAGSVIAFLLPLPLALPVLESRPSDWLWVFFLGAFQIGLAYALLTAGVRSVPAFEAALLLLIEPVFNPIWAFLAHREIPGAATALGGALIVLTTVGKTYLDTRPRSTI